MDRSENLAYQYLCRAGFDPIFEPLGEKTCPDFEISDSTAIEVRRLNENYFNNDQPNGLDASARKIEDAVEGLFSEISHDNPKANYWVSLEFKRPLLKPRKLKNKLRTHLNELIHIGKDIPNDIIIENSILLNFKTKDTIENQIFHLGIINDLDTGGWLLETLHRNINFCIKEKTTKIQKIQKHYSHKWLILVDGISYGELNEYEKKRLIKHIDINQTLNRIIIIDAINGNEIITI